MKYFNIKCEGHIIENYPAILFEENGKFNFVLFYFEKTGSWSKGDTLFEINYKPQRFIADKEEDAILKAKNWSKKNIDEKCELHEKD